MSITSFAYCPCAFHNHPHTQVTHPLLLWYTTSKSESSIIRRRKEITCSFSKKNGEFGLCFLKFIEQVISLQALSRRQRITGSSPKKNAGSRHCFLRFMAQVVFDKNQGRAGNRLSSLHPSGRQEALAEMHRVHRPGSFSGCGIRRLQIA